MPNDPWLLRRATAADAMAVAVMHVRSWQVAYRGIVPDEFLDSMDVTTRAARYAFDDRRSPTDPLTWIAVQDRRVLGGVSVSASRDDDAPHLGEIGSLYVHPDLWGTGVGRELMAKGERLLLDEGYTDALLWVLEANGRARRFYEAAGWRPDGEHKLIAIGGQAIPEVRYRKALDAPLIRTERLELVAMSLAFMRALAAGDLETAAREIGATLPEDMPEDLANFLRYRIPTVEANPAARPWLGRSMVWTHPDGRREVIGTIGFHEPPDETGRVEIGYRVEPAFRRRGIVTECVRALLAWAETQGIHRFRASVAPDNVASLAVVRSFGFVQVGSQMDEVDGEELVFDLDRDANGTR